MYPMSNAVVRLLAALSVLFGGVGLSAYDQVSSCRLLSSEELARDARGSAPENCTQNYSYTFCGEAFPACAPNDGNKDKCTKNCEGCSGDRLRSEYCNTTYPWN